jgi:hypothetical protein
MAGRHLGWVAAATGAAFVLSAGLAQAADDGYENVVSSVLTAVGVMTPDKTPDIDYRERPALVLPPKMTLVKPADGAGPKTAAWPKDPDVIKRRKAAEEARAPSLNILGNVDTKMSHDDAMKGRIDAADSGEVPESAARQARCGNNGNQRSCLVLSPDEMKSMDERYEASGLGQKKELAVGEEPEREYLTQPPKGYLRISKAVKATTEAPKPKLDDANPKTQLMYHEKPDDE